MLTMTRLLHWLPCPDTPRRGPRPIWPRELGLWYITNWARCCPIVIVHCERASPSSSFAFISPPVRLERRFVALACLWAICSSEGSPTVIAGACHRSCVALVEIACSADVKAAVSELELGGRSGIVSLLLTFASSFGLFPARRLRNHTPVMLI